MPPPGANTASSRQCRWLGTDTASGTDAAAGR